MKLRHQLTHLPQWKRHNSPFQTNLNRRLPLVQTRVGCPLGIKLLFRSLAHNDYGLSQGLASFRGHPVGQTREAAMNIGVQRRSAALTGKDPNT
jgi:hypothetical protein